MRVAKAERASRPSAVTDAGLSALFRGLFEGEKSISRSKLVKLMGPLIRKRRKEIRKAFTSGSVNGRTTARRLSDLTDSVIRALAEAALQLHPNPNPTDAEAIAILATGGYGRRELAPFSDVDLLFLVPGKRGAWVETFVETILYALWDLGLKVGHAVRSADENIRLAKGDLSIRTAMLDARFLWGDEELYDTAIARFQKKIVAGAGPRFVEEKLAERGARHVRTGGSRYLVEPNVKDGKGGLRDLHTLYWIGRFLYGVDSIDGLVEHGVITIKESRAFRKAENFLWTVRCYLHYQHGRGDDRMGFDVQRQLASRLGYRDHPGLSGVERFMKHYFLTAKQVGDLTRIFCASLEARHQKTRLFGLKEFRRKRRIEGFPVASGRLNIDSDQDFREDPLKLIRIFWAADAYGYDIHPDALSQIARDLNLIDRSFRRDPEANELFMEILTSRENGEETLRRMNEAGVFGRFVPDFGRIVAQSQFDMYHHYTVDEHTIRAIGLLARLERGELRKDHPLISDVINTIDSRRVLYVAVLLHDIAKGRGGRHSEIGAEIANRLCLRLGFSEAETELTAWLVLRHLLMSHFAFKRDLADSETVDNFVRRVKSPERLKLLTVLTAVDIRAVGPDVWNAWKAKLLSELYFSAEERLVAGRVSIGRESRVRAVQKALARRLRGWTAAERKEHFGRFGDAYWLAEDVDMLALNARLMRDAMAEGQKIAVGHSLDKSRGIARVSVFTRDRPGLFVRITGALAVAGANIRDAKIFTTRDGWAVDNFAIEDKEGRPFAGPDRVDKLNRTIRQALAGRLDVREALARPSVIPKRTDVFQVAPLAIIDNKVSDSVTVIEVNGRDRPGLLFDLASVLHDRKISVRSAHVATYGERAVDVFYVREADGGKIAHGRRIASLKARLTAAAGGQ